MDSEAVEFDVVVVGAGISGVAAGHYLQQECPDRSYVILEGREAIGGTWDLFRYPGVRSDSDMFTLGFSFRPWLSDLQIAPGPQIREYVQETARAEGIDRHIRFGQRVTAAAWDSSQARWSVTVRTADGELRYRCRFLYFCSGYYDYAQGHEPDWPGRAQFRGRIVHPQLWPEDLDYEGKRVVVIGSGATAATLLPEMARKAAHVTMLQRSPSYILSIPGRDGIGAALQKVLPRRLAYRLIRWKNILGAMALYHAVRRWPDAGRRWLQKMAQRQLGPGFDARHLKPPYAPWDQRMCFVPDADLFRALRSGRADIVTDQIAQFTPDGIRLVSGQDLPADIVVTATGLRLQMLGGATLTVDGRAIDLSRHLAYKGVLASGIPNLALALGYINASWTLKCELSARYVCRLLNHMRAHGYDICLPQAPSAGGATRPAFDLRSGYVQRASDVLLRQGARKPWRMVQNYLHDLAALRYGALEDGALRFARR